MSWFVMAVYLRDENSPQYFIVFHGMRALRLEQLDCLHWILYHLLLKVVIKDFKKKEKDSTQSQVSVERF